MTRVLALLVQLAVAKRGLRQVTDQHAGDNAAAEVLEQRARVRRWQRRLDAEVKREAETS